MKYRISITLLFFLHQICIAQFQAGISVSLDLKKIEQIEIEGNEKVDAAFAAMQMVQQTGSYVSSISDLLVSGSMHFPVGIKKGDYELIIQRISYDDDSDKLFLHATCAFRLTDSGQRIAFEGIAEIQGENGMDTRGELVLIAPVKRNIGNTSAIIFHEGSRVRFGCEGIEDFAMKLTWLVTSQQIIAVDNFGNPVDEPIAATTDAYFENFDNYLISLTIDRAFIFKGMSDFLFTIRGATLDQSDVETSAMTVFPEGYLSSPDERNLWRGVSFADASVSLPVVFKSPTDGGRITLSLRNALFDQNGFSGDATASDILNSALLDPAQWDISVSEFILSFLKNEPVAVGFGGDINIPPFGENSLFPYTAVYNHAAEEFQFRVSISGIYDFPILASTLTLHESSRVEVSIKDGELFPVVDASGILSVNAPISENNDEPVFSVPDIPFQNMRISRDAPYLSIGRIGVSGDLRVPLIYGFELMISDIQPFSNNVACGLTFTTSISLSDIFSGSTKILLHGNYEQWKFDKVTVEQINVDYQSNAFSLSGGVWLIDSDAMYGDGFRGEITLKLLNKFQFDAVGVFGKKDDFRYFLTDAFFEVPPPGLSVPPLGFYGFGGGLYRRMQQNTSTLVSNFGKSLSGINYVPDRTVGMGVMASAKFGLSGSPSAFNSRVSLEMQFNNSGGLNFVQFRGDAAMMSAPDGWGSLSDNVSKAIAEVEANGNVMRAANRNDLENKMPENKGSGALSASINIKYDIINSVFSADMSTYLNAGLIRGIGANDRMGWASAYFSPSRWYTYVGSPSDRMGIEALRLARLDGYFMIGNDIPGLPPPPEKVLRNLSANSQTQLRRNNAVSFDRGIAFGAGMNMNFNATLPPFYASLGAGIGSEFILVDSRGQTCINLGGAPPGINGWFAGGQAWAWVEAAIGLQAKIFRQTHRFNILDISVAALLSGSGPNPMYFSGNVGGQFNVMGGLIKGYCSFDFEIGDKCDLSGGVSPFGEDIISQITPASGEQDVNVFAAPQVVFNIPIDREMIIEENGVRERYKIKLEEFSVNYTNLPIAINGNKRHSNNGTVHVFDPYEPFESQESITVYAKVIFQKKVGNGWENVKDNDGQTIFEDKSITFTSGERPNHIPPEYVKYSYPIELQYNYYPDEYRLGFLQLSKNLEYLFTTNIPEGCHQVIRFYEVRGGTSQDVAFTHRMHPTDSDIRMEIEFSKQGLMFVNNGIYKMTILNVPIAEQADIDSNVESVSVGVTGIDDVTVTTQHAEGNIEMIEETEIYSLHFRTSNFNTFAEKMNSFDTRGEGWRKNVEPFVHHVHANLRGNESFDKYETHWDGSNLPLIRFEALLEQTPWYNNSIYPQMYGLPSYSQNIIENRRRIDMRSFGVPPAAAVYISSVGERSVTNGEIITGTATGHNLQGLLTYALPYWSARDFYHLRTLIATKARNGSITQAEAGLLGADFPAMVRLGSYPVRARYMLPGRGITTSMVELEMYCPVE